MVALRPGDHWIGVKQEPDGSVRGYLVISEVAGDERLGIFNVGLNDGADVLRREIESFVERHPGWDSVMAARLDVKLIRQARALEMPFFDHMGVYAEIWTKSVAKARGGEAIQGRWVDTNKGMQLLPTTAPGSSGKS